MFVPYKYDIIKKQYICFQKLLPFFYTCFEFMRPQSDLLSCRRSMFVVLIDGRSCDSSVWKLFSREEFSR